MAEKKSESKQTNLKAGQVPPTVNKVNEFGGVPPKLNLARDIIVGGDVPPPLNLAGQIAVKGMVPQALPKIPLEQVVQPSQSSSSSTNTSGDTSNSSSDGQSTSTDKK